MDRSPGALALSVVVARTDCEPRIRNCLRALVPQARALGAEVLLCEGSVPRVPAEEYPDVVRVHEAGASVFRLRALGMAEARGEVVAFTEDHCVVTGDWCQRVLESHADHPHAVAIGGVVENGAVASRLDWAHFLIPNGRCLNPLADEPTRWVGGPANLSVKRRIIPATFPPEGIQENLWLWGLRAAGEELRTDRRPTVWHVQSLGVARTAATHFHIGRTLAGFRLKTLGWPEWALRLGACSILPAVLVVRCALTVLSKRRPDVPLASALPWMLCLATLHSVGEAVGYLRGPGSSPAKMM